MKQEIFESYDGSLLQKYVFECENPKAIIQIAHGMQEYSATYFEFAEFLSKNGFLVVLFDQRGHGKSVKQQDIGKVNKESKNSVSLPTDFDIKSIKDDIFRQTLADHILMTKLLKNEYNLPVYYIGHSYGSFIGQAYLEECKDMDKVVLIGSGYMKKPLIYLARTVAGLGKTFKGIDSQATIVEKLSFESYKKKFSSGSWVTSDFEETQKFYSDPLNATPFSTGFYNSMFKNQIKHPNVKACKNISKQLPILLISGESDVIGDMGKGVTKLYEIYKACLLNVKLKLYPNMRHAILQEKEKQQVFDEILDFLKEN